MLSGFNFKNSIIEDVAKLCLMIILCPCFLIIFFIFLEDVANKKDFMFYVKDKTNLDWDKSTPNYKQFSTFKLWLFKPYSNNS